MSYRSLVPTNLYMAARYASTCIGSSGCASPLIELPSMRTSSAAFPARCSVTPLSSTRPSPSVSIVSAAAAPVHRVTVVLTITSCSSSTTSRPSPPNLVLLRICRVVVLVRSPLMISLAVEAGADNLPKVFEKSFRSLSIEDCESTWSAVSTVQGLFGVVPLNRRTTHIKVV